MTPEQQVGARGRFKRDCVLLCWALTMRAFGRKVEKIGPGLWQRTE